MVEKKKPMTTKKHKQRELSVSEQLKQWYIVVALVLLVVSVGLYVFEVWVNTSYTGVVGERYLYARFVFSTSILFLITSIACGIAIAKSKGWWKVLFILGLLFGLYAGATQMFASFLY